MPCYSPDNTDKQRGDGVFEKSITALRRLNELGYGREETGLLLTLVYNPLGPSLPPPQPALEADYRRELDLDCAMATTTWRSGNVTFKRVAFASDGDQAIVIHLTSDRPGQINFVLKMDSPHTNSQTTALSSDTLSLMGQV